MAKKNNKNIGYKKVADTSFIDGEVASLKKSNIDKYDELEVYKDLRQKRKKRAWLRALVWTMVLVFSPFIIFFSLLIISPSSGVSFFGYTFYIVQSESMKPIFDVNDGIIIKSVQSQDEIEIGTDICFIRKSDGKTVTHRVIGTVVNSADEIEYITKGVHNIPADEETVLFENIIGRRIGVMHVIGHIVAFCRTPAGIVLFILFFMLLTFGFALSFRYSRDIRAVGY